MLMFSHSRSFEGLTTMGLEIGKDKKTLYTPRSRSRAEVERARHVSANRPAMSCWRVSARLWHL